MNAAEIGACRGVTGFRSVHDDDVAQPRVAPKICFSSSLSSPTLKSLDLAQDHKGYSVSAEMKERGCHNDRSDVSSVYYAARSCACVCTCAREGLRTPSDKITGHVGRLNSSEHLRTASRETVNHRRKEKKTQS